MKTKSILQITASIFMAYLIVFPAHGANTTIQDEGTHVVIHSIPHDIEGSPRSQSAINIEATLYEDDCTITVHLQNAGTVVAVTIDNFANGDNYQYLVSGNGTDNLSFTPAPGFWHILFTLADGTQYYGTFTI